MVTNSAVSSGKKNKQQSSTAGSSSTEAVLNSQGVFEKLQAAATKSGGTAKGGGNSQMACGILLFGQTATDSDSSRSKRFVNAVKDALQE